MSPQTNMRPRKGLAALPETRSGSAPWGAGPVGEADAPCLYPISNHSFYGGDDRLCLGDCLGTALASFGLSQIFVCLSAARACRYRLPALTVEPPAQRALFRTKVVHAANLSAWIAARIARPISSGI